MPLSQKINGFKIQNKTPFSKTKEDYVDDLLTIGKQHVQAGLLIHMFYTIFVNILRYTYGSKEDEKVNSYAIFGVFACLLNLILIFIVKTRHQIFTTVITFNQSVGVFIVTEMFISRNPDQFVFSP